MGRDRVYSFTGGSDGAYPVAGLIFDSKGALYSTTYKGGSHGYGTVFKLTPPDQDKTDWTQTVLHSFDDFDGDGRYPVAGLIIDSEGRALWHDAIWWDGCSNWRCGAVARFSG